jgi:hypothetical protein
MARELTREAGASTAGLHRRERRLRPGRVVSRPEMRLKKPLEGVVMSTPLSDHYKGFEIKVQALRRAKERDEPDDGPRHFDIVVTIARSSSGESGKAEMFGVPEQEPFDSPIDATRAGIDYARDIIDNKVEGQSVDEL